MFINYGSILFGLVFIPNIRALNRQMAFRSKYIQRQ